MIDYERVYEKDCVDLSFLSMFDMRSIRMIYDTIDTNKEKLCFRADGGNLFIRIKSKNMENAIYRNYEEIQLLEIYDFLYEYEKINNSMKKINKLDSELYSKLSNILIEEDLIVIIKDMDVYKNKNNTTNGVLILADYNTGDVIGKKFFSYKMKTIIGGRYNKLELSQCLWLR